MEASSLTMSSRLLATSNYAELRSAALRVRHTVLVRCVGRDDSASSSESSIVRIMNVRHSHSHSHNAMFVLLNSSEVRFTILSLLVRWRSAINTADVARSRIHRCLRQIRCIQFDSSVNGETSV
jgi:hypothetical protein